MAPCSTGGNSFAFAGTARVPLGLQRCSWQRVSAQVVLYGPEFTDVIVEGSGSEELADPKLKLAGGCRNYPYSCDTFAHRRRNPGIFHSTKQKDLYCSWRTEPSQLTATRRITEEPGSCTKTKSGLNGSVITGSRHDKRLLTANQNWLRVIIFESSGQAFFGFQSAVAYSLTRCRAIRRANNILARVSIEEQFITITSLQSTSVITVRPTLRRRFRMLR